MCRTTYSSSDSGVNGFAPPAIHSRRILMSSADTFGPLPRGSPIELLALRIIVANRRRVRRHRQSLELDVAHFLAAHGACADDALLVRVGLGLHRQLAQVHLEAQRIRRRHLTDQLLGAAA